mmetsp:Transcript_6190/g.19862  ORF Transcript_6190/g.19862 Transcript_6190/m.19862 type:complete len:236 (+) Transcript_6190:70-777(+)
MTGTTKSRAEPGIFPSSARPAHHTCQPASKACMQAGKQARMQAIMHACMAPRATAHQRAGRPSKLCPRSYPTPKSSWQSAFADACTEGGTLMSLYKKGSGTMPRQANATAPTMMGTSPGITPVALSQKAGLSHNSVNHPGAWPRTATNHSAQAKAHSAAPLRCSHLYASQDTSAIKSGKYAIFPRMAQTPLVTISLVDASNMLGTCVSTVKPNLVGTKKNAPLQGTPAGPQEAWR